MKRFAVILLVMIAFGAQAQEATWFTDFEKAKKTAQKQKKPILMYFTGSDWCSPCKMLKKDFWEHPDFVAQSEDFVLVEVDVPFRLDIISESQMKKNKALQAKYNKEKSFPTLLALDASGKVKDRISAYSMLRDTTPYFKFIDKARAIR